MDLIKKNRICKYIYIGGLSRGAHLFISTNAYSFATAIRKEGHYPNPALCRASSGLPNVFSGTRQTTSLPSAKKNTRQRKILGKEGYLPSVKKHSAKGGLCRVFFLTLGKDPLCRVPKKHSTKKILNQNLKP